VCDNGHAEQLTVEAENRAGQDLVGFQKEQLGAGFADAMGKVFRATIEWCGQGFSTPGTDFLRGLFCSF
jgi:hypothetical protein